MDDEIVIKIKEIIEKTDNHELRKIYITLNQLERTIINYILTEDPNDLDSRDLLYDLERTRDYFIKKYPGLESVNDSLFSEQKKM